jgi:hypothetical protein
VAEAEAEITTESTTYTPGATACRATVTTQKHEHRSEMIQGGHPKGLAGSATSADGGVSDIVSASSTALAMSNVAFQCVDS